MTTLGAALISASAVILKKKYRLSKERIASYGYVEPGSAFEQALLMKEMNDKGFTKTRKSK